MKRLLEMELGRSLEGLLFLMIDFSLFTPLPMFLLMLLVACWMGLQGTAETSMDSKLSAMEAGRGGGEESVGGISSESRPFWVWMGIG